MAADPQCALAFQHRHRTVGILPYSGPQHNHSAHFFEPARTQAGVDDETGGAGTVTFSVVGDGNDHADWANPVLTCS